MNAMVHTCARKGQRDKAVDESYEPTRATPAAEEARYRFAPGALVDCRQILS